MTVDNLFPNSAYENSSRTFVVTVDLRSCRDLSGTLEIGIDGTVLDIDDSVMSWHQMFNTFVVVTEPENNIIAFLRIFFFEFSNSLTLVYDKLCAIDVRLERFFNDMFPIIDVVESIDGRVYTLVNFCTKTFSGYLVSFDSFVRSFWDTLRSLYDEVVETIGGFFEKQTEALLGDGSEADAFEEAGQQAQEELDSAGDALDSLEKPDSGEVSGQINDVIGNSGINVYGTAFIGVFDSPIISTIMLSSAIFMLASYALFGKKD